jgi:hypothetical protein
MARMRAERSMKADTLKALTLVAMLGFSLSAALLPHVGPDALGWVFTHLE